MFSHWMNQQANSISNQDSFLCVSECVTHASPAVQGNTFELQHHTSDSSAGHNKGDSKYGTCQYLARSRPLLFFTLSRLNNLSLNSKMSIIGVLILLKERHYRWIGWKSANRYHNETSPLDYLHSDNSFSYNKISQMLFKYADEALSD